MLNNAKKRQLKSLAHHLNPIVIVGNQGLTEAVVAELDLALSRHELVKVRVNAADRDERRAIIAQMEQQSRAELVQHIGHVAVLFRTSPSARIQFT